MSPVELLGTAAAAALIGLLIGMVGIGGVLLVPWLTHGVGLPVPQAVPIALVGFVATGAVAWWQSRQRESPPLTGGGRWLAAAAIGALFGALLLSWVPESVATVWLAIALAVVGGRMLVPARGLRNGTASAARPRSEHAVAQPGPGVGLAAGLVSALTGTGGPVVLVPLLVWRGMPLLTAVRFGQWAQLPVAATATLGNGLAGQVDWRVGALVGVAMLPGALVGPRLAHRLPLHWLSRGIGAMLIATAIGFVARGLP